MSWLDAALIGAYSGDFDFGGEAGVRAVDLLGMTGTPLAAIAGYIEMDRKMMRVITITLPVVINDLWTQEYRVTDNENNVSLGFIHSGSVRVEFMISVMNVINHPKIGNFSNSSAGPLVALARNNLAARFLDRGKEDWLWCLDTDIVFAPDTIDRLLAAADPVERPIVSALYYTIWDVPGGDHLPGQPGRRGPVQRAERVR